MRVGSKSILFGAHCFFIHPWFVALAWWRLFGFPWDPRLWVAFFVHDLGYWGKPNMDGPEGETHPELGGRIMGGLFDSIYGSRKYWGFFIKTHLQRIFRIPFGRLPDYDATWKNFTIYHSRSYARKHGASISKLCIADKLAISLTPYWLYIPLATLSGEIEEYMADAKKLHPKNCPNDVIYFELQSSNKRLWFRGLRWFMREWVKDNNKFVSINT